MVMVAWRWQHGLALSLDNLLVVGRNRNAVLLTNSLTQWLARSLDGRFVVGLGCGGMRLKKAAILTNLCSSCTHGEKFYSVRGGVESNTGWGVS